MKNDEQKETLYSVLLENDEKKIEDFLLKNGKKKPYCPICFDRDKSEDQTIIDN